MLKTFLENIENQELFYADQKVLLAVSGGIDSMVMAALFGSAKFDFGIAHCNFMLRNAESNEDAAFVKNAASDLGVKYFEKTFDTQQIALQKRQSIQVAARQLRYEWFNQLIIEHNFDCFATAHQFDDQTETFFINLFRGTGISGLRGILPKNGKCVRPLLFATRDEIKKFAAENGISFREDSSNNSDKYLRNKIRHLVIPSLEKVYPDFRKGFEKTFQNLSGAERILDNEIAKKSQAIIENENGRIKMRIKELQNFDPLPDYLFEILKPFNFNYSTVEDICQSLEGNSGKNFFSPTHHLTVNRDYLMIVPVEEPDFDAKVTDFLIDEETNSISYPLHLSLKKIEIDENFQIQKSASLAQLDFDKLQFPLKLRKWKQGDLFIPLGMKGKKLLSDYFIDEKIPVYDKHKIWLLVSDDDIVWVLGHRISEKYKITEKSKKALIIKPI